MKVHGLRIFTALYFAHGHPSPPPVVDPRMDPGIVSSPVVEVVKHPSGWLELRMNRMKKFNRSEIMFHGMYLATMFKVFISAFLKRELGRTDEDQIFFKS